MNRYEIVLANGYGRELHRETVGASELRLALLVSSALLERHPEAVSASVELLGELGEPDRRWQQDEHSGRWYVTDQHGVRLHGPYLEPSGDPERATMPLPAQLAATNNDGVYGGDAHPAEPVTCRCESSVCPCGGRCTSTDVRPAPVQWLQGEPMCERCIQQYLAAGYGVEEAEPCWQIADDGDAYQPLTPAELNEASIGLGEIDGSES